MSVEGVASNWKNVTRGIVLGPIHFVIFIIDMPEEVKYNVFKLFADNCKLYGRVRTSENKLQHDLSNQSGSNDGNYHSTPLNAR